MPYNILMTKYIYDIEVKCGRGLIYPSMGFHYSSTVQPPDNDDIQREIVRAQKIIALEESCVGCTVFCQLRNLANADLDTVRSVLFNLPVINGSIPAETTS